MRSKAQKDAAILWCLERQPGMTSRELSLVTGMWPATVSILLFHLEQASQVRMVFTPGPYPRMARFYRETR